MPAGDKHPVVYTDVDRDGRDGVGLDQPPYRPAQGSGTTGLEGGWQGAVAGGSAIGPSQDGGCSAKRSPNAVCRLRPER